jgi:hypothetical protein
MTLANPVALARREVLSRQLPLLAAATAATLLGVAPALAQDITSAAPVRRARIEANRALAQRKYDLQMIPRWPLGGAGVHTVDGSARAPWRVTTWGPMNGESSHMATGAPASEYTGEFLMYWSRIPDFRILEYKVWPTEEGWIARLIFGGTAKDGTSVRAHQVDIVTVDETGKVVRIEWHCDAGEWIRNVWSKSGGLSEQAVREVLAKPKGWERLIDIALGRTSACYGPVGAC